MTILEMLAVVGTVTQVAKSFLSKWINFESSKIYGVTLSVIVSAGVVAYDTITNQKQWEQFIGTFLQVAVYVNGGYKLLSKVQPKK